VSAFKRQTETNTVQHDTNPVTEKTRFELKSWKTKSRKEKSAEDDCGPNDLDPRHLPSRKEMFRIPLALWWEQVKDEN
jgi:hypothetical protein